MWTIEIQKNHEYNRQTNDDPARGVRSDTTHYDLNSIGAMMNFTRNILIVSVWRANQDEQTNMTNTMNTVNMLRLNPANEFLAVIGCYNNEQEISFVLPNNPSNNVIVNQLVTKFRQHSYLFINSMGEGLLIGQGWLENLKGTFQVVAERYALRQPAYTFEPTTRTYWVFA